MNAKPDLRQSFPAAFSIDGELLLRFGEFKHFGEVILVDDLVGFPRPRSVGDVFDSLPLEDLGDVLKS